MTEEEANLKEYRQPRVSFQTMRVVMAARGLRPKFNRLAVAQWLANPNRKPQAAEARVCKSLRDISGALSENLEGTFLMSLSLRTADILS
jgi:hypothetical protein